MSAINQYFGQNAVSSLYQYQTPQKHSNYLTTNTSLGYSSFTNSNQFKSSQLKSQFTHITLVKDSPYSDAQSQREYILQNNSEVTLNPVDSEDQINKIKQIMRLVQHLSRENQQTKNYVNTKVKFLFQLRQHVQNLEMKVAKQKKKYETDKKELKARQDKLIKRKKKRQSLIQQQLEQMVYVLKLRYSLSKNNHKKQSPGHKHQRSYSQKHNNFGHHQDYSNTYPLQYNPNEVQKNFKQIPDNSQNRIAQSQLIARAPFHMNNPHYSIYNPENKAIFSMKSANINQSLASKTSNPLHLLAEKLSVKPHTLFSQSFKKQSQQEEGIIQTKDILQLQMKQARYSTNQHLSNMNRYGSLNININEARGILQLQNEEPDLAYFQENQNQASKIVGRSLKVLEEQKENSDCQDMNQMVSLLQHSIQNSSRMNPLQTYKLLKVQPDDKVAKKSDMGFNLIETNLGEDFIFTLPEYSRQKSRINDSKIEISIDSEEKRQNKSRCEESCELKTKKQSSRSDFLLQSNININMQETIQSPLNSHGNPQHLVRKVEQCSPQQILSNIQEVEEDIISRQNTPIDFTNNYEFAQSQNRLRKSKEHQRHLRSSSNNLSDSNQNPNKNLPLSRPPSLKEEEENALNDINYSQFGLDTIKLQTVSRISREEGEKKSAENTKPKVYQIENVNNKSQRGALNIKITKSKINEDFDEDDLFGIKLVTQSKISRQGKTKFKSILENSRDISDLNHSEDFLTFQSKGGDKMSKSQPMSLRLKKSTHQLSEEDNSHEQIDTIRKSTTSSIVRKGSAIQKIKDRQQVNTLKVSNYGAKNNVKSSAFLSNTIAEDEEQEEQIQQSRFKKDTSNFK